MKRLAAVLVLLAAACGGEPTDPPIEAGVVVAKRIDPERVAWRYCASGVAPNPKMPGLTVCTWWQEVKDGPYWVLTVDECEVPADGCRVEDVSVDTGTWETTAVGDRWRRS